MTGEALLERCFDTADRIIGWSRAGIELTKRQLWNSLDASSLQTHMDAEGVAQLFVRITTQNFEESVRARRENVHLTSSTSSRRVDQRMGGHAK